MPAMLPAMALADTFSLGVTLSLPQAWRIKPLEASGLSVSVLRENHKEKGG